MAKRNYEVLANTLFDGGDRHFRGAVVALDRKRGDQLVADKLVRPASGPVKESDEPQGGAASPDPGNVAQQPAQPAPAVEQPKGNASKQEWVDYARSVDPSLDEDYFKDMGRDEIAKEFGDNPEPSA